jgi:ribonuclease HI
MELLVYTDGSCLGNPGPGGAAFLVADMQRNVLYEAGAGKAWTTNNERELTAFSMAIDYVSNLTGVTKINFYLDSQYVLNSIKNGWVYNWLRTNQTYRPNYDLWEEVFISWVDLTKRVNCQLNWVKAHNVDELNGRVDELARTYARNPNLK